MVDLSWSRIEAPSTIGLRIIFSLWQVYQSGVKWFVYVTGYTCCRIPKELLQPSCAVVACTPISIGVSKSCWKNFLLFLKKIQYLSCSPCPDCKNLWNNRCLLAKCLTTKSLQPRKILSKQTGFQSLAMYVFLMTVTDINSEHGIPATVFISNH